MALFTQFDPLKQPKYKIELHVHLDGAVRLFTIWELAQKKGIDLHCKSYDEFVTKCKVEKPSTLANFLAPFSLVIPCIFGDYAALERIAYEFCEDLAQQNVLYAEVRYCPHLLCIPHGDVVLEGDGRPSLVVASILNGLKKGQQCFNVKVSTILCCFRTHPEWSRGVLDLCKEYRNEGVVGIDIAGDEAAIMASPEDIAIFQEAAKCGIHRTAHAAEAGPAENALLAIQEMKVERIGHGYHVLDNEDVYRKCLTAGVHFEVCPYSSYMTGSVPLGSAKHPIIRFAEDNANFSISRDDPFILQKSLEEEYSLLELLGMTSVHIARANFNAARNSFLPDDEKNQLIQMLYKTYGIN